MSKGNDIQKKKKDVWVDERMEESMMDDTLFRESVRGGCHWPYKFMSWKTGNRRHAVRNGMMVM